MLPKIKKFIRAVFLNWKETVFLAFLFRICGSIILFHIGGFLMNLALRASSYSYLTARNAINFLCSPVTAVCLVILFILLFLFSYFESGILLTGFQASVGGFRISCGQLLLSSFKRGAERFKPRRLPAAVSLLSFSIISNLYFLVHLFYRINPFCTYLPIAMEPIAAKIIVILFLILLAIDAFLHLFSFCHLFLGDDIKREAYRKSRMILRRHPFAIFCAFFAGCIAAALFWHLLRFICAAGIKLAVNTFAAADIRTALFLTLEQYMILVTFALCITFGSYLHSGIITVLFYHFSEYSADEREIVYKQLIPQRQRRILLPSGIALFIGLILYFYFGIYNGIIQAERAIPFIQISAHRGVCSEAPENTLPAIELAIDYLADSVEIDVQCTEDGVVVVFHDTSLKRVTGVSRAVANMTFEELRELDAAVYSDPVYQGTPIPTLEEVMEVVKGRINLIIELKRNKSGDDLVEKVLALIDEYDMEHQCVIQSSDYQYLRQVKEFNPNLTTGYILSTAIGNYYDNEYIDFFCVRSAFVTRSTVNQAHAAGKEIFAWTVNSKDELERMKRIQVDTIITDYPIRAREILYRQEQEDFLLMNDDGVTVLQN